MNRNLIKFLAAMALLAGSLSAASIALTPSGTASGAPGTTTGWGFSVDNDSINWIVIDSITPLGFDPAFGTFTEFAETNFNVIAPNSVFTEVFDFALNQGFGKFDISAVATPGTFTSGTFQVRYITFSSDPLLDAGAGFITNENSFSPMAAEVQVTDAVPEPTTLALAGTALLALVCLRRRP